MKPLDENDAIDGLQLLRADPSLPSPRITGQLLVLLHGRCVGSISAIMDDLGDWSWRSPKTYGQSTSQQRAIAALIELDYEKRDSLPLDQYISAADMAELKKLEKDLKKPKQDTPTEDEIKIHTLEQTVEQLQDEWWTMKALIKQLESDLVKAKSELFTSTADREHWCNMAHALQEHAHRVYWLGQENGFNQASTFVSRQGPSLSFEEVTETVTQIEKWRLQAIDNAEKKKPMPTVVSAVEADRMKKKKADKESVSDSPAPAYRPTPEETAELKKVTNAIGAAAASVLHTLLCGPTKEVQAAGLSSSSASTAAKKTDPETMLRNEIQRVRDQRDFLTWSAARLANVIRSLWTALSWEETRHSRGLLTTQANAMLAMLTDKAMRRDSDGRLIINWENVLDPAHYGGTVSDGMKHWLDSLWKTT